MSKKTKTVPMKTFRISFNVELDEDQIWPDGDGPTFPSEDDVIRRLRDYARPWTGGEVRGVGIALEDWLLTNELEVKEVR